MYGKHSARISGGHANVWGPMQTTVLTAIWVSSLRFAKSPAATLRGAFERKEPILAFAYFPHWVVKRNDGEFVKWPDISPAGFIWKIGNTEFMNTVPDARRLLFLFELDAPTVGAAMDRIDNGGEAAEAVAADWIAKNESTWKSWLR